MLPVSDRGLNYGDGLFETMRIVGSRPILADLHWQRLEVGLERLRIAVSRNTIEAQLQQLLDRAAAARRREGIVKILVSRGDSGRGFVPTGQAGPTVVISWFELPSHPVQWYRDGVQLVLCKLRLPHRPQLAGLKHLNCLDYVLAGLELPGEAGVQGLLLDQEGMLIEALSSNLFLVVQGNLYTPLLHRCGIAGTMRRWIMETVAPELEVTLLEKDLPLETLYEADEVFICNSVFGVVPVAGVGDRRWQRGPVTAAVQRRVMMLFDA